MVIDINISNFGESAYLTKLFVTYPVSLNYIGTKQKDSGACTLVSNNTLVVCAIGNPFKQDKSVNLQIRFDPKDVKDKEKNLEFIVFANSTSQDKGNKETIRLNALIRRRAELSITG